MLDLLRPIYQKTAAYGHFGREEPSQLGEARQGRGLEGCGRALIRLFSVGR